MFRIKASYYPIISYVKFHILLLTNELCKNGGASLPCYSLVNTNDLVNVGFNEREHFIWEGGPEADTILTEKGLIAGTAPYMSPEQGAGQDATIASDVYSLGVILYELLTGQVPIRGATPQETIQRIQRHTPAPPTALNPRLDRRLERICLKCLQKNPQDRYGAALSLAHDLKRWLNDKPLAFARGGLGERCRLWCRRNPAFAGLMLTGLVLLLFVIAMTVSVLRKRVDRLEREVLKSNVYAAQGVASTMLLKFRDWATKVYRISEEPKLLRLLEGNDRVKLQQCVEQIQREPLDSIVLLDRQGMVIAGAGGKFDFGRRFHFRDYFHGARRQEKQVGVDSVYISRAYRSSGDGKYRISVSRALNNGWVLVGFIKTHPTMGLEQLHDDRHKAVLVGPEDPNPRPGERRLASSEEYLILLHESYDEKGQDPIPISMTTVALPPKPAEAKQLSLPDISRQGSSAYYFDPVSHSKKEYEGRWLAGFAPVGNTDFVVIVQQRYDEAIPSDFGIIWSGAAVLLGALFIVAIGWLGFQRTEKVG